MSLLVYIAGPYSHPDPLLNGRNAILVAERIYDRSQHELVPVVPHTTMLWQLVAPHEDVDFWYEYDMKILARCDGLLRIPGESWGADEEVRFALARGIPVFHNEDALFGWTDDRSETFVFERDMR